MLYTTAKIAGKEYKLSLNTQGAIDLDKRLGKSAMDVLLSMAHALPDGSIDLSTISIPQTGDIVTILHALFQQYQHGTTVADVCKICDAHVEQGGNRQDFINMIVEALTVAGFLPRGATETAQQPETETPDALEA